MNILKDINELVDVGILTEETADKIQDYYKKKRNSTPNGLFIVFGIIGAVLVGLGVIMIIAHNWDELSRASKTIFAFVPMLIGQGLCGYALLKKQDSITWRESSATFLFFAIGACIALISQIYNMPGNLSSFLLVWMLLCLPIIYLMKSSAVSMLYLIGITNYATEIGYGRRGGESYLYWLMLLLALPHYYLLYKENPKSNFMVLHNWLIPISIIIALGTIAKDLSELILIPYFSLFGLFYLIGEHSFFDKQKIRSNSYKILGSLGTMILLLILSFDFFWESLKSTEFDFNDVVVSPEFIGATIITLLAIGFLYLSMKNKPLKDVSPLTPVFILFIVIFIIGMYSSISILLINIIVFVLGVWTIREGERRDNFGVLNYGLLIITSLVVCRFLDIDLSFVFRGLLFVFVGVGFFLTNYWMLKKRRSND
jgi:uncharacterized membrane protein